MGTCQLCGAKSKVISTFLGVCRSCIINKPEVALNVTDWQHALSRNRFFLPYPISSTGVKCGFCGNNCGIEEGKIGFCGLKINQDGKILKPKNLIAEAYYDPHPTNCVPMNFCGASGVGYPKYSYVEKREIGYSNLSIFCIGCSYDCSFCQNWHYREMGRKIEKYEITLEQFNLMVYEEVSCICFFGGDPCVQLDKISEYCKSVEGKNKILRFCLETNGNFNQKLLKNFADICFRSGGGIKFDLKFWNPNLNKAFTGVDNKNSYECFKLLGELHEKRREIPFLRASTLMMPGYITPVEVQCIAKFIGDIDSEIPYSLLAFSPNFEMKNLPFTSKKLAYECKTQAEKYLKKVRIGNKWLLTD
jgi:pyruvate formate lyase activating enzyme